MKIGLSLSRCVRDIYEGKVDIYDVMVIVARTDFDPEDDSHWKSLWRGYAGGNGGGSLYSQPEWASIPAEDEDAVREICTKLKKMGKLHQPRQFGAHPPRLNYYWLETVPAADEMSPAAQEAYDHFRMIAKLTAA